MEAYFSCSIQLCLSWSSLSRYMEEIRFCLVWASPCTAQDEVSGRGRWASGKLRNSIICPRTASARTMAGFRYLKASSKALMVRSHISCTEEGARTMLW